MFKKWPIFTDRVFIDTHDKIIIFCQIVPQLLVFSLHTDWLSSIQSVFRTNLMPLKTNNGNKFLSCNGNTMLNS